MINKVSVNSGIGSCSVDPHITDMRTLQPDYNNSKFDSTKGKSCVVHSVEPRQDQKNKNY